MCGSWSLTTSTIPSPFIAPEKSSIPSFTYSNCFIIGTMQHADSQFPLHPGQPIYMCLYICVCTMQKKSHNMFACNIPRDRFAKTSPLISVVHYFSSLLPFDSSQVGSQTPLKKAASNTAACFHSFCKQYYFCVYRIKCKCSLKIISLLCPLCF